MTTLSITADFGGNFKIDQFDREIRASLITTTFNGIVTVDDLITLMFESTLTEGEQTILTDLITNHVPDYSKPRRTKNTIIPDLNHSCSTTYFTLSTFVFDGTAILGDLNYIDVLAKTSSGTFDIRVVNVSDSTIIAEKTGNTNTIFEIIDLGTLTNIPSERSILELQVRVNNKANKSDVRQILLYINN